MKPILLTSAALVVFALAGCSTNSNPAVEAGEHEIYTISGEYAGKLKYAEISSDQALLQIDLPNDKITDISAGWIGNGYSYREQFSTAAGFIQFNKTGEGYWQESYFTPDSIGRSLFYEKGLIEFKSARKLGRRLIAVEGKRRFNQNDCAGLVYAGVDVPIAEGDLFSDWYLISVFCDFSLSQDELVASAAVRMAGVKKDGRRIVNLTRYDLPSPKP